MMEAVSGSATAAGIYLKVAAGMDKEGGDMARGQGEAEGGRDGPVMKGKIWPKSGRV